MTSYSELQCSPRHSQPITTSPAKLAQRRGVCSSDSWEFPPSIWWDSRFYLLVFRGFGRIVISYWRSQARDCMCFGDLGTGIGVIAGLERVYKVARGMG